MRRKQLVFVSLFLLGSFLVASGAVWGQAATSVRGTVTDPSGAAIPNARVHLLEVATNAERTATTDSQGNYAFSQVVPDTYKLTVEAEGFATYERPGVVLRVNLPSTINARMKIGQAHEVVTVTEAEPVLNMTDASEGNTMGQMQIQQLPIEAKDVTQLLSLQPGVIYTSDRTDLNTNTYDTRGGAVNGERSDQNNVTLDGADDNQQNTGAAFQSVLPVPIESVQEFRVTTSNYGADQGRSAGAQVTLVTRSGSNGFHGAAYEFNRSAIGEANDYFIKQSEGNSGQANKPLPLVRNIFGGAVGGPIKKDRLFFFVNYEGRRRAQADSVVRTIPTASLRDGAMMYLCQTQSDGKTPVDSRCNGPSSVKGRSGASYNVPAGYYGLSPSQIAGMDPLGLGPNSASLKYFNTYPLPNDTTVGDGYNFSGYRFPGHVYERDEWLVARIDYKITANGNHTLFWRGSGRNDIVPGVYGPGSLDTSGDPFLPGQPPLSTLLDRSKGFVLGYTAVLRPNLVNNFHYGYTRQSNVFLGISNQPWIYVRLLSQPINYTQDFILPVNNFVDDLTWTKGNHSFSFGTDIRLIRNSTSNFNNSYNYGTTNAAWLDTAGFANTGSPFSPDNSTVCGGTACPAVDSTFTNSYDFPLIGMLGMVSEVDGLYNYNVQKNGSATALAQGAPISRNWADGEYDLYFQDSWKRRSNLTFN
ncbi:MAG: carboxypeptidase regulatory-like domain-containing protein, partial [Blastocatellia bacterium]